MAKLTVEDTSLTAVADAIRAKGGTTDALVFPDGFVNGIESIKGNNYLPGTIDGSTTDITADMLEGCTRVKDYAFYRDPTLKSIVIPSSVIELGTNAFNSCPSLERVSIPNGLNRIAGNVFQACSNLEGLTLPYVKYTGQYIAASSGITYLVLEDGWTSVPAYAFYGCSKLTSISLPDSLTSIAINAFEACKAITNLTIPKNVTSIGGASLRNCTNLATLEMKPVSPPSISNSTLQGCGALTEIIVPVGSLDAYKSATNWSVFADIMVEATE